MMSNCIIGLIYLFFSFTFWIRPTSDQCFPKRSVRNYLLSYCTSPHSRGNMQHAIISHGANTSFFQRLFVEITVWVSYSYTVWLSAQRWDFMWICSASVETWPAQAKADQWSQPSNTSCPVPPQLSSLFPLLFSGVPVCFRVVKPVVFTEGSPIDPRRPLHTTLLLGGGAPWHLTSIPPPLSFEHSSACKSRFIDYLKMSRCHCSIPG